MSDGADDNANQSKVEAAKIAGDHLRGTIRQVLEDDSIPAFEHDDLQMLKFHGVYQQDDRDQRIARKKAGLDKAYSMMIRVGLPSGECTADQYIAMDNLCDSHANGTLRLTTRQAFQLHGVLKGNLKATMADIQRNLMTSLAACGDIPRNFMAPPTTIKTPVYLEVQRLSRELKQQLAPATGAYVEIWLDGERVKEGAAEEPFYGDQYLPRKFKVAVAIDTDNSVDVFANDCGLIAITDGADTARGYNLTVGGGFGMTHKKADTIARIASPICFVTPDQAEEAVRTVVEIFRDHGEREDRRHARIKYMLEQWGVDKLRAEMSRRMGVELPPAVETQRPFQHDHMGLGEQGDGKFYYGVFVENGRIADFDGGPRYKSAFRRICEELKPEVRLTPMQSIVFGELDRAQVDRLIDILREHGIKTVDELSKLRRYSMACVALPTCGLALSDSERVMPGIVDMLEELFESEGLADLDLTVRMTGCPNGCARPYNADIGFVGRKPGVYNVHVGGGLSGDRIADVYANDVKVEDFVDTLRPLLRAFKAGRTNGESLSDYYQRAMGRTETRILITGAEDPTIETVDLTVSAAG